MDTTETTSLMTLDAKRFPSLESIRSRMDWMTGMRQLLVEYVEKSMDPARHMYSFTDNAYTRIENPAAIKAMLAKGQKPSLNLDGVHNLMSLYECDVVNEQILENRDGGHYAVRVVVTMTYFGSRTVIGNGSCSTAESKYAYRWVFENDVPTHLKETLEVREFTGRNGRPYKKYRLPNERVADLENTVLKMAVKRAKASAVQELPGVSEMFASVGDPGDDDPDSEGHEERGRHERNRQEALTGIRNWMAPIPKENRARAVRAVFGKLLVWGDIEAMEEEGLRQALSKIQTCADLVNWGSHTIEEDVPKAIVAGGIKAGQEVFGTGVILPERKPAQAPKDTGEGSAWHVTLTTHHPKLAAEVARVGGHQVRSFLEQVEGAIHDPAAVNTSDALQLAAAITEWIEALEGQDDAPVPDDETPSTGKVGK